MDPYDITDLVETRINELIDNCLKTGKKAISPEVLEEKKLAAVQSTKTMVQNALRDVRDELRLMTEEEMAAASNLTPVEASAKRSLLEFIEFDVEAEECRRTLDFGLVLANEILAEAWLPEEAPKSGDGSHQTASDHASFPTTATGEGALEPQDDDDPLLDNIEKENQ
ncbi:hypothetical protein F5Y13DRAFT_187563 [Hypoxylon sp. FL1857]|nr:hypothetical protein F5Y13DRAFT_187563 [Hypoxylon sp. FL1857]